MNKGRLKTMKQAICVGITLAMALLVAPAAIAAPASMKALESTPALPLHLSAVFCNAKGCQQVNHAKRCEERQTTTGKQRICNF